MAGGLSEAGAARGPGSPRTPRRRAAFAGVVVVVLLLHAALTQQMAEQIGEFSVAAPAVARLQVAYVRELAPAAPLVAAPHAASPPPVAPRVAKSTAPRPPRAPASAPQAPPAEPAGAAASSPSPGPAASDAPVAPPSAAGSDAAVATAAASTAAEAAAASAASVAAADSAATAREPVSAPASAGPAADAAAPAATAPASAADEPPAFDWPVSTRVGYRLVGNVRGEVHGDAQVEWVRVGSRYQVHLDVTVGLPIAPLMTRRMSSDGEITAAGLAPLRYDQDTKVGFGSRQRVAVQFEPDAIVLANGTRRERMPGVQDTASQFIQLTWLFTTQPERLRPGQPVEIPLALPRSVSHWIYDVVGEETVYTPIGPLAAVHLKPRRALVKGGDLAVETWFSPQLRYLPVRIRIEQDAETWIDLVIARRPELAAAK